MASKDPEAFEVQHQFHFRYDRRLSCFSNAVSCLNFTGDGQYLVSGTGSGDIKVWDSTTWAEAAKLKSGRRAEPKEVAISPSQRWVVVCYSAMLQIFQCGAPWKLVQSRPVEGPKDKEPEWCCVAFSPMLEVDHPHGQAGQDNHLAAFSNCHISLMDYSGGWSEDVPQRTRSLMGTSWPSSLSYTGDGYFIICGFSNGQMQIWNAFSLSLEKTLNGHEAAVTSIAASPPQSPYDPRLVSCSKDQCLRVWHVNTWLLEQHVHELRCDRGGLRCCNFSATGTWLVAVGSELVVWRVCVSARTKKFDLQLHQRLEAVCGSESIRTATFSSQSDVIAVGSHDGILGLWRKHQGLPPLPEQLPAPSDRTAASDGAARASGAQAESTTPMSKLSRPLQRITPQGVKPLNQKPPEQPQRTRPSFASRPSRGSVQGLSPVALGGRLSLQGTDLAMMAAVRSDPESPPEVRQPRRQTCKTSTLLGGWQPACLDEVFSGVKGVESAGLLANAERVVNKAPNRELMARARGLVKRIALDPKIITNESNGSGA
ncbi:unnamed protein product [Durusdinium trenchii]|uniref:Uncharacterized protein n=1 Tax=Durusdinium trenchii TaxID=1381693 RepID=A0ABP0R6E3_9DINO